MYCVVFHYQYNISVLVQQTCQNIARISSISLVHRILHQILSQILSEKKVKLNKFYLHKPTDNLCAILRILLSSFGEEDF